MSAAPTHLQTQHTPTCFAWWYRYVYFRIFRWLEVQKTGSPEPHNVSGYLLSILTLLQFQFVAVLIDGVFGTSLVLNASKSRIICQMLGLGFFFFAITYYFLIRNGKWQRVLKDFSAFSDTKGAMAADRWFKVFVAGSMSLFPLSMIVAAAIGPRI